MYRLVLAAESDVELSASTTGSFTQAYLALTTDCATPGATLACAGSGSASFRRRGVPAGTYYVMIESSDSSSAEWSLSVTITTPPAPGRSAMRARPRSRSR